MNSSLIIGKLSTNGGVIYSIENWTKKRACFDVIVLNFQTNIIIQKFNLLLGLKLRQLVGRGGPDLDIDKTWQLLRVPFLVFIIVMKTFFRKAF